MIYGLVFVVQFVYIALKALQQRQVMAAEYWKMPLVSMAMAFCEVFIVANVASVAIMARNAHGLLSLVALALSIGSGAALGSISGTWVHARKR